MWQGGREDALTAKKRLLSYGNDYLTHKKWVKGGNNATFAPNFSDYDNIWRIGTGCPFDPGNRCIRISTPYSYTGESDTGFAERYARPGRTGADWHRENSSFWIAFIAVG
jgi:hypothetical protein